MDQKSWLWRKKSTDKTITANGEEVQSLPSEKEVEFENSLRALNDKLASVIEECSGKDDLVQDYERMVQEAVQEKQKAHEEIQRLKKELDDVQQQKVVANERLGHLNSALKDSMQQLNLVRQEQEQCIQGAIMKTSQEFEKTHKNLEERLAETNKSLGSLTLENSYLTRAILVKDKLIEDLNNRKCQTDAEFGALMTRLDSVEKENAFLRYELQTYEKELDLRNEELDYSHRSAEASHKQHMENIKKTKRLETECQRLRALTRKRLPGSAALANIKSDTRIQGRRDTSGGIVSRDSSKKLNFLIDHVRDLEKENEILKEFLAQKEEEISCIWKVKNLAPEANLDLQVSKVPPDELSFTSGYGTVGSNEIDSSHSLATAIISQQELDRSMVQETAARCKTIGTSDINLMDDFIEVEKLAIVSVDAPTGGSFAASDASHTFSDFSKEIVPFGHDVETESKARDPFQKESRNWLQNVTNVIFEQHKISKRSLNELLGDIRTILHGMITELQPISGYITWKPPTSSPGTNLIQDHSTDKDEFSNNILYQDQSIVQDIFKKHLGGDRPGTALELESVQKLMFEMEKICSIFQIEIKRLKNELNLIKSSGNDSDVRLQSAKQDKKQLTHELTEPRERIVSLENELEILKESKRVTEDELENQKLINEDLDAQLNLTKAKLIGALQKLSAVEVELDDKGHCCEELQGTCLDLQLQLESISTNQHPEDNENPEALLRTGIEITKASARLEECEQAILKLGKQLKAHGSTKELAVVDKYLSITNATRKKFKPRLSLHEILSEDGAEVEIKSTIRENESSVLIDSQGTTAKSYLKQKSISKISNAGSLVIVPGKSKGGEGGFGFLRKLLLRKKKTNKKTTSYFSK